MEDLASGSRLARYLVKGKPTYTMYMYLNIKIWSFKNEWEYIYLELHVKKNI